MKLNYHCPINDTSYGIASSNFLENFDMDVSLFPIGQISKTNFSPYLLEKVKTGLSKADEFDKNAPTFKLFHQNHLAERIGSGKYFAMPIFETRLDKRSITHCKSVDHLIVNSNWAKRIIDDQVGVPVSICELGVNTDIFFPSANTKKKRYSFLCVAKAERRKGYDALIEAFDRAFSTSDDVELLIMWNNPFLSGNKWDYYNNLVNKSKNRANIKILPPVPSDREMAEIMNFADCGIFLTRGEGFGLPILEMMACGKPIITTSYGGQSEFANKNNSFIVDINQLEPAVDPDWPHFNGEFEWAKIGDREIDQAVHWMKVCYESRLNNPQGLAKAQSLSWKKVTEKLCSILKENS